jgi:DNA-binding response OmpR family regulator
MADHKVLIIDDDAQIRLGLNARLRASGYQTVFAEDCIGAVSVALRERPDAILLDIGLPGGDGFLVLKRLKANTGLAHIPVIVVSAREPEQNEKRSLEAGAVAYLQKPVENEELLARLSEAVTPA